MPRIYREVEDIQEPTPRPSGDAAVKIPSAAPFDSQKRIEKLEGGFGELGKKVEAMGADVADIKKTMTEAFGKKEQEMPDELEGEESTDPHDAGGINISNVDNTQSGARPVQPMEERKLSRRRSVVGQSVRESFDVRRSVKEYLKNTGGA